MLPDGNWIHTSLYDGSVKEWIATYTRASDIKDYQEITITRPSDIVEDLVTKELGATTLHKKNIEDDGWRFDFSIHEEEKGIDVLANIALNSNFFYRTNIADGQPSIVGLKSQYSDSDVDKQININDLYSYNFSKTPVKDVAIKCRVKYRFDYVSEELVKVTDDITHDSSVLQDYKTRYSVTDESTFLLEHEAPYIQDEFVAIKLRNYLFELNKNQHIKLKFSTSLDRAIELEVGDTLEFVDNSGNRSNIGDVKPFGLDITDTQTIIDQDVYPYFMITSIKKDIKKVDIDCVQLHKLGS